MGGYSSDENTPNAPEFICPICLPNPKSSGFQWNDDALGIRSSGPRAWIFNIYKIFLNKVFTRKIVYAFEGS